MSHPYRLSDSASRHLATATSIARDVLAAHAADVDAGARFPAESIDALSRAGLLGLPLPASHGGQGEGMRAFAAEVTHDFSAFVRNPPGAGVSAETGAQNCEREPRSENASVVRCSPDASWRRSASRPASFAPEAIACEAATCMT